MSATPEIIDRLARGARSIARTNGYPFIERHTLWPERLQVNLPELQCLENMAGICGDRYQVVPGATPKAGSRVPADYPGIAATAHAARKNPDTLADAALLASSEAVRHSELNAFIQLVRPEDLTQQAETAARALATGNPCSLLGVPIGVKDLMAVEGFQLTGGTHATHNEPSTSDAVAIRRLRRAGALILGTTTLHELAYGITSRNPHYGFVVNPLAADRTPGGSSGGSAAAVAAGIVRAGVGTDTAGSIRIPAACCGVVGFKPTFDSISRQGIMHLGPSLDHCGPIARSVGDAALMFSVMAGQPAQIPPDLRSLDGVRVGVPSHYFFDPLSAEVDDAVQAALKRMQADGADLVPVELPGIQNSAAVQLATLCSEATDVHWQRLVSRPDTLGDDVRIRLEIGQLFPAFWYTRAQRARSELDARFRAAMAGVAIRVTPTLRIAPPAADASMVTIQGHSMPLHAALTSLTLPFNLTGMPALTLPCGRDTNGLSIGLQLAAARNDDWRLLAISSRVETLLEQDWRLV